MQKWPDSMIGWATLLPDTMVGCATFLPACDTWKQDIAIQNG
jgi:hypothetical protein